MDKKFFFSDKELKLLNTNKAIKLLLAQEDNINPEKVLRYVRYEKTLEDLQVELIKMQQWVIKNNKRVCLLFEGRDAAGKGGAIRRVTHHLNPGEVVLFDRSWYNRGVVEPVNGFCSQEEYERFMSEVNHFEEMITNDGVILMKFYFSITKKEQAARFEDIASNPLKRWKMSPVDEVAQELWDTYTEYKERMFAHTNTEKNPWIILRANRKTTARVAVIKHILKRIPYKEKA